MDNPLLGLAAGHEIPFDAIRAEHVEPAIATLLAEARARLAAIETSSERTYASTVGALERMSEDLGVAMGVVSHLEGVATNPAFRAAYTAVQPLVSAFFSSIALSDGAWRALQAFAATPEAAALQGEERRFLQKTLDDFRRSGAELDARGKERLAAIDVELTNLTVRYAQNVLDATGRFELVVTDRARLAGLPESALKAARESAEAHGKTGWRLTLQAPSYIPAMTYLDDGGIRESLYRAYHTKATAGDVDNRALVARVVELRGEKGRLLGFSTFADLVLADRMAANAARAIAFVEDLRSRIAPHFARENEELAAFRREAGDLGEMRPWDNLYWSEKQRRARFDFDEEALRPYLPADAVLAGAFEIAQRVYGVRIEPGAGRVWHESVRPFVVKDASGATIASFYVDLFPRETKQDGAWMHGLVNGVGGAPHLAVVVANVSPPSSDGPALLGVREAETVFHEFGHLMHHCLSKVRVRSLAGTQVPTDFVELPSKIMENWFWEREALDLFARHHETGARIPDELIAKLKRARTYRAANLLTRQLGFASLDLALHASYSPAADGDVVAYARRIFQAFSPTELPDDYAMIASFSHLFADPVGYAAGYYSYAWADVLDADAFTRFKRAGIFDAEVGARFRDAILAAGNSDDPMVLYRRFAGAEPKLDALLARMGFAA